MDSLLSATLYLLALINPVSKIFVLTTLSKQMDARQLRRLSVMASAVGLAILLVFAFTGKIILTRVFHVEIYSFQMVGGLVLFFVGYRALTKGVFFEAPNAEQLEEMSIVPLASPMIAGPATITASVAFSVQHDHWLTSAAILLAVAANLGVMLISGVISRVLIRYNLMGALIRITGLIVATIAAQMVLDGIHGWYRTLA